MYERTYTQTTAHTVHTIVVGGVVSVHIRRHMYVRTW